MLDGPLGVAGLAVAGGGAGSTAPRVPAPRSALVAVPARARNVRNGVQYRSV